MGKRTGIWQLPYGERFLNYKLQIMASVAGCNSVFSAPFEAPLPAGEATCIRVSLLQPTTVIFVG